MTSLCWCACDMWRFRDARQIRRMWRALCLLPPRAQEERKVGGGMFNLDSSSPTVTNSTFSGNSADDGGLDHSAVWVLFLHGTPGNCLWDIDANGSVGVSDPLARLVNWGPCP